MNRIFEPQEYYDLPDGTKLCAFLNTTDTTRHDVPWNLPGDVSIASGLLVPGVESWIHMLPVVTQTTYVVSGEVRVWMKSADDAGPERLDLVSGQAVVTEPGTLFQITNPSDAPAYVLYIVSPSYIFEKNANGDLVHDDSVLLARTWEELAQANYDLPALKEERSIAESRRLEAKSRIKPVE